MADRLANNLTYSRYKYHTFFGKNINIPKVGYNFIKFRNSLKVKKNSLIYINFFNDGNIAIDTSGTSPYSDLYCDDIGKTYTRPDPNVNWRFYFRTVTNTLEHSTINLTQTYSNPGDYNISVVYNNSFVNVNQLIKILQRKFFYKILLLKYS
jgi:hypothetical protein